MSGWPSRIAGIAVCVVAAVAPAQEKPGPVYPNLLVEISRPMADEMGRQEIDQTDPICQNKGKLTLVGSQHTRALISTTFVPSGNGAIMDLVLSGGTNANTDAYQGKVHLNLSTRVSYTAHKRILINELGVTDIGPAASCPRLDENTLNCIGTSFRGPLDPLVRKIATRVYYKKLPETEAGIIRDAREQIEKQFNETAAKQLAETNARYVKEIRDPLTKRNAWPQRFRFLTSDTQLGVRLLLNDPRGKPQSFVPPPDVPDGLDFAVRVEQSYPMNVTQGAFAGKTFTSAQLEKEFNLLAGPLGKEVKIDEAGETGFSITFPDDRPMVFKFDKQTVTVTFRGKEFNTGESSQGAWDITAVYKLRKTARGFVAERQGELVVYPPGFDLNKGDRLSLQDKAFQRLLQKKFGRVLTEKMEIKGKADLVTRVIESDKGWLVLGMALDAKKK
ncbi:MAG: hypothetical protein ACJ8F7_18005 [Gemmataceae bacterium]